MSFSINTPVSDGVTKQFPVTFTNGIYDRAAVHVYVEDDIDGNGDQIERSFTWINDGIIELDVVAPAGKTVTIRREMNRDAPDVDYVDGAILDEANLDQSMDHLLNLIHEIFDGTGIESINVDLDLNGNKLTNLGEGTDDKDSVTLLQVRTLIANLSQGVVAVQEESQTGADIVDNKTTFQDITFTQNLRNLLVFRNGQKLKANRDYIENSDNSITWLASINASDDLDFLTNISTTNSTTDTSAVTHIESGKTQNLATYLQDQHINVVEDYSDLVVDGDWTAAIQTAINNTNGLLGLRGTGYTITSQLDLISGTCTGIVGIGEVDCVITKQFNGDALIVNNQGATFKDFWIVGNDAGGFTGGGIYVNADDCLIERVRITDTQESPIICKAKDGTSGSSTSLRVLNCFLQTANPATYYAIRSDGNDISASPTARVFDQIRGGSTLVNFAGMNRAVLTNTFGTRIGFDSNCSKVSISGCRFTNAGEDITVLGQSHAFSNNLFGFGTGYNLIFDASCSGVKYDDSNLNSINGAANSVVQDNAAVGNVGTTNSIDQELVDWSANLEWKGDTTDGVFGNSTVVAYYSKSARTCSFSFGFIRGSTATIPTGTWSFTLPFKALVIAAGTLQVKSSTGVWYNASWIVQGGSNVVTITVEGANGPMDETDISFGTNAQMQGSLIYQIAST